MNVKVAAHPVTGLVFTPSTNPLKPDWGKMRVDSTSITYKGNLLVESNRSAFIAMKQSTFEKMKFVVGMSLKGIIQRKLAFIPFYEKADGNPQEPVSKGPGGDVVLMNGAPYFQDYEYNEDPTVKADVWILPAVIPAEIVAEPAIALQTATVVGP